MNLIQKIFGTHSEREVKMIMPLVEKIEGLRSTMQALSDEELRDKTREYKDRLAEGATLDDILPEAFATVREAARRVLNMEHYRVQLIGGIILHQGRIAEMKTGEGKTLVSTLPAYLNALAGKGVHIVTVNDYLAHRDAEWMGKVHEFLGLTVGCVLNEMDNDERRAQYACDITYVTNNELGFDYLRDNMVIYKEQLVQRELHYAIIDEIDSILIDEARTPLIISGQSGKSTKLYEVCDILARQLERGEASGEVTKMSAIMGEEITETGDFIVNEKDKVVNLTAQGIKKVEKFFQIENLADPENLEIQHNVNLALRAHNLMHRDQDYVVKEDQVLIVDEFTGRIMPGRRYSDGLHQAIEAKEHVKVKRESKTLATITFQNFFNKYAKKSGMTGTALTEEKEFRDIYGMDVIEIPTNKPVVRQDLDDAVYMTKKEKFQAVVESIVEAHEKGQPVLVGTITIETSELLSGMLKREGIPHKVLNAKFHELEAEIVAEAGRHGAVTIATNMAGRGTDIKLDDESREAGGLKIIGTERHESRRIDNQLRGRSGRQGDPGESRFYISLEDDLMRLFGSERLMGIFKSLGVAENEQIEHKMLSKAIENAQKKIESNNYGIRKNLLEYDQVNNEQREIIYNERRRVLDGENMRDSILKMIADTVDNTVDMCISDDQGTEEWDIHELESLLTPIIPMKVTVQENMKKNELKQSLKEQAVKLYESKEAEFPEAEQIRELERVLLLKVIDRKWMDHIDDMDQLRQGIGLQAYGQRDPLVEFKMSGYEMFDAMSAAIQEDTLRLLYHVRIEQKVEREEVAKVTGTNKDESLQKAPKKRVEQKVYPNDPCPCGSGKKYKQCCGRKK
ncbi:MAG: preprotein translocase subunit SecA [Lachnospiraceae bacterium]|jgi:preprotein translocase subunit SecA|uniref:Preprotein translocase subunit SecA n=1 Tax=Hominisplanchenecus murintestinalis TaxID=2941517 RepID=A0AC61QY72_9FIRM|nr:preprotein translocase subunit SecA [Hominisplanchenecus murintestinalis]MCI9517293.1 preprotein translocase subunit SecA [Lachnospiraceae bacterium]RKJ95793.1 preprotein translocase subunit SecA [Anaerotruncus sp. 1XD22-93]MCI9661872.1 preprotein translocase subunit SecA [Lachnospiraceae bacterium]NBH97685.1 preprotein translocase subunit SecA [Lachnospiraceae bacterium]NBI74741.1 preprotein translocase subunit SecA [Lachnospiraceae bacterium]